MSLQSDCWKSGRGCAGRFAVEVRNKNWLDARLTDLLRDHTRRVGTNRLVVYAEAVGMKGALDLVTADFGYVRYGEAKANMLCSCNDSLMPRDGPRLGGRGPLVSRSWMRTGTVSLPRWSPKTAGTSSPRWGPVRFTRKGETGCVAFEEMPGRCRRTAYNSQMWTTSQVQDERTETGSILKQILGVTKPLN